MKKMIIALALLSAIGCSNGKRAANGSPKPPTRHKVLSVEDNPTGGKLVRLSGIPKKSLLFSDTLKVGDSITINWLRGQRY